MIADRRDLKRACVAAATVQRQHPKWRLRLYVRGSLPAPWTDLSASCFEQRASLYDLPPSTIEAGSLGEAGGMRDLATVFAQLFREGEFLAVYLNHDHAWFRPLPPLGSKDHVSALWTTHRRPHTGLRALAMLSVPRLDDMASVLSCCTVAEVETSTNHLQASSEKRAVVGLDFQDLRDAQLRFDSEGELMLGEATVLSACLGNRYEDCPEGIASETTWLELEKWFFSELERFD